MFTVFPLINIILLPLFGQAADAFSRRTVIWFGVWLEIAALVLYLIDGHWAIIVAARLLDAIAASTVVLITLAKIEDCVSRERRGKDTGLSLSLMYLGELLGPLAGGILADYFFIKMPFLTAGAVLFILSIYLRSGGLRKFDRQSLGLFSLSWLRPIRLFLSHRELRGMGILGMVMHASNPAMRVFLPLLIVGTIGMSYKAIGIAMFCYSIPHLLQGVFGAWGDRFGHHRIVLAGVGLSALCLVGIYFAPGYAWILALLIVLGIGGSMWNVGAWSLMSDIGESAKAEAQIITSYMAIAQIGSLISFIISAWLVSVFGIPFIFLVNGVVIALGILAAAVYLKPQFKHT